MLDEICAELKNYFAKDEDRFIDDWTISNGVITPQIDMPTAYIRIVGSRLNDGVYKVSELATKLEDETFHGAIWVMSPPRAFLDLVKEIEAWQAEYGGATSTALSPFSSESFGGYSYSKATGTRSGGGTSSAAPSWQATYAARLKRYRRIREL